MKNIYKYIVTLMVLVSCKPTVKEAAPNRGSADFTTYVAVGNSLTAGYADGALYKTGQLNSYPFILSQQFALVGGNPDFKQPLMSNDDGVGFVGTTPFTKYTLAPVKDCQGNVSLSPVNKAGNLLDLAPSAITGPFNNVGVPGAKSFHLLTPKLGISFLQGGNPFYERFALHPGDSTVLDDAMHINPTFFTLWIGSNDVLLYALSGGDKSKDSITPTPYFTNAMGAVVARLTSGGAKGAIANIPDITNIPYFTTVPYNGLVLTDPAQVTQLNAAYAKLGITFALGQNPFIVQDISSPYPRQIKAGEYLLLNTPQDSLKCGGWGSITPIPHTYVLDLNEVSKIKAATGDYNAVIAQLASTYKLALVDMNQNLSQLSSGIVYSGVTFNAQFVTGGAFSLDGVHLNPRGYALVANYYITSINNHYGSTIPMVDVTKFSGVVFP